MGAAAGGALGEQLSWDSSSKGQVFSPLHPASRGQKLFPAPSNPCFEGTSLLDLNTLGVSGLHHLRWPRLYLVLSKVQDAKLPVGGETLGLKPACKSGICLLLPAFCVCAGTQLLLCPHALPSFGGT